MSTIIDNPTPQIARRISRERDARDWSLGELAARSGVSKAMLSKIEREEASPSAVILGRIASAFGLTLASLLSEAALPKARLLRAKEQATWRDPATGYVRRQIYLSAQSPLELVEVDLPAGASVAFPAASYELVRHVVVMLKGRLTIVEGDGRSELTPGDRLEFGPPENCEYRNESSQPCRYLVVLLRQ